MISLHKNFCECSLSYIAHKTSAIFFFRYHLEWLQCVFKMRKKIKFLLTEICVSLAFSIASHFYLVYLGVPLGLRKIHQSIIPFKYWMLSQNSINYFKYIQQIKNIKNNPEIVISHLRFIYPIYASNAN